MKLRPDGVVKVLDFGLAKALDSSTGAAFADALENTDSEGADQDVDDLPTEAGHATHVGAILGTARMAPEQAMGKPVDRRADIWGFGILLFEMLSGRKAYSGDTRARRRWPRSSSETSTGTCCRPRCRRRLSRCSGGA